MHNFDNNFEEGDEHELFQPISNSLVDSLQVLALEEIPLTVFPKSCQENVSKQIPMKNQFLFYSIITSFLLLICILFLNEISIFFYEANLSISMDFGIISANNTQQFLDQVKILQKNGVDTVSIEYVSENNGTEKLKALIKEIKQIANETKIEVIYNMFAANQFRQQQLANQSDVFLVSFDSLSGFHENKQFFCPFSLSAQPFIKRELEEIMQSNCDSINLKVEFIENLKELDFCYCNACMNRSQNALGFDVSLDEIPIFNQEWQKYKLHELQMFLNNMIQMCQAKLNVFIQFFPEPSISYISNEDEGKAVGLRKALKVKEKQIILEDVENIEFVKLTSKEVKFNYDKYYRVYQRNIIIKIEQNEQNLKDKFLKKLKNAKKIQRIILKSELGVQQQQLEEIQTLLKANLSK